jgi:hypothetical protein
MDAAVMKGRPCRIMACVSGRVLGFGLSNRRGHAQQLASQLQAGLASRAGQQIIDYGFVLSGDVCYLCRQGEHDMEVANRQQVGLALGQLGTSSDALTLRAVPVAAGVVGDPPVPAIIAGLDVTAQRGGAAILDDRHEL